MAETENGQILERLARLEELTRQVVESTSHIKPISDLVIQLQARQETHGKEINTLFTEVRALEGQVSAGSVELKKWVDRGTGAYTVLALLAGIVVWMAQGYINAIQTNSQSILAIDNRTRVMEYKLNVSDRPK